MNKRFLRLLSFFILLPCLSFPQNEEEKILYYGSEINIHKDASITVTETIKVSALGNKIKRGIYRDFPVKYKDKLGNNFTVDMDILEIKRNGLIEDYHTEKISNGIRIYIGNENIYLNPGIYTYTISYKTNRQLGFFQDHDELYWNVTGNGWDFKIDEASSVVMLPESAPSTELKYYGYTGPSGSTEKNLETKFLSPGKVSYKTIHPLLENEGLTIVLEFPKGLVTEPSQGQKFRYFLNDNIGGIAGALGLLIILVYYLITWRKVGKDPEKNIIVPLFNPPDDLSPSSVRFINKMGFDNKTFAAAIIDMAVKGFLTIKEDKDKYTLIRKKNDISILAGDEKRVASKLIFTAGGNADYKIKEAIPGLKKLSESNNFIARKFSSMISSAIESKIDTQSESDAGEKEYQLELDNKNHTVFREAIQTLKKQLKNSYEKTYFITNRKFFVLGVILSLFFIVISFIFTEPEAIFILIWLLVWTTCISFLVIMVFKSWQNVFAGKRVKFSLIGSAVFITLFSIPFILGEFAGIYFLYTEGSPLTAFLAGAAALLNLIFYNLLKAPTLLGRKVLDKIEGFKIYLSTAEKERLNYIVPADETPEVFEKYLPYALALDVEQEWAEKFSSILDKAVIEKNYSPSWYSGNNWSAFGSGSFVSSFSSSFSSAVSSSSTAPGSSSGSGGSSGGGGGGGGGGGW